MSDDSPSRTRDEMLIAAAQSGDDAALREIIDRFSGLVSFRARGTRLPGAELEDVLQEARIGLLKAVRDYRFDRGARFRTFAEICVRRQLATALRGASRLKHRPLNGYVPLDTPKEHDSILAHRDLIFRDPAEEILTTLGSRETARRLGDSLTPLEAGVLRHHLAGETYANIAGRVGVSVKGVDNALQRVRRKLRMTQASQESPA